MAMLLMEEDGEELADDGTSRSKVALANGVSVGWDPFKSRFLK